ncbi:hypothetical protein [Oceanobacillus sp. FSL H7-0719]|uniref:hypothetical protein n=1 Tax=Oceanobacillus sp. FSL H7-0719 TaxID=2954507 RepID=UPI00324CEBE3
MSKHKFEFITLIAKGNYYWEYESLQEFKEQEGEEELRNIIGYFPIKSNVTYDELNNYGNNSNWVVCFDDANNGGQVVKTFNSLLNLKLELDELIERSYRNEYINIYNANDFVYL